MPIGGIGLPTSLIGAGSEEPGLKIYRRGAAFAAAVAASFVGVLFIWVPGSARISSLCCITRLVLSPGSSSNSTGDNDACDIIEVIKGFLGAMLSILAPVLLSPEFHYVLRTLGKEKREIFLVLPS